MKRYKDWMNQAEEDLKAAEDSLATSHYEWTCFQCQQSVEKILKAFLDYNNVSMRGHSIRNLLGNCSEFADIPLKMTRDAVELDFHYIQPRYPTGFTTGYPAQYYTKEKALDVIRIAREIVKFFKAKIN
ncbi:MAG: HEPN domain-containing protein [Candidatus Helarchaeota archaeon]